MTTKQKEYEEVSPAMRRARERWLELFYDTDEGLSAGLPALLTRHLAMLVTAELTVTCGDSPRGKWLEEQLRPALDRLQTAVQLAAAGGEVLLRPTVTGGRLQVELIPLWQQLSLRADPDGQPVEGVLQDWEGDAVRLERFSYDPESGLLRVENRCFRCDSGGLFLLEEELGRELPLSAVPRWAELERETVSEGFSAPPVAAIRMPFANCVEPGSSLPVSVYAGAEDCIREFDTLFREFLYEFHSGKRKRIVEREAIRPRAVDRMPGGVPVGLTYRDMTTDTYLVLDPEEPGKPFDDYTPTLRAEEYLLGLKTLLAMIENRCGLSPGTLSLDDRTGRLTAAQVISDDRTTYITCAALQRGLRQGLLRLVTACDELARSAGLGPEGDVEPCIGFGDSVFEDTGTELDRRLRLVQDGLLKPEKLLAWYFSVDEETARRDYLPKGGGSHDE